LILLDFTLGSPGNVHSLKTMNTIIFIYLFIDMNHKLETMIIIGLKI